MSDFINQKLAEREAEKMNAQKQQVLQDAALRKKLSDKLKDVTVVKRKAFWWLPAFFAKRVIMAGKIADLEKVLFSYQEHAAKQSTALKGIYKWALEHDPGDGSLDSFKAEFGPLDPTVGWKR